jgi:E3 ubiquitin-protein ligase HERC3
MKTAIRLAWLLALLTIGLAFSARAQTPAVSVVAGGYHTCAILVDGGIACWGYNASGQLGLGDTVNRGDAAGQMGSTLRRPFFGKSGPVRQLALGGYHTCVLDAGGEVRCWGYNGYGQLGYGHIDDLGDNPQEVYALLPPVIDGVKQIAAGAYHTCALKIGGQVLCWGYNAYGQLGAGDQQNRRDGVNNTFAVPSLGTGRKAVDIAAAGFSTCALLDNGQVKCWGFGGVGTLGYGDSRWRGYQPGEMGDALPVVDVGLGVGAIERLSAGAYHVCAASNNGFKCWGGNDFGQLGLGDINNRGDGPAEMGAALPLQGGFRWSVVAGFAHTCVPTNGTGAFLFRMKCFGQNTYGQLGLGDTVNRGDNPGEVSGNGAGLPARIDLGLRPGTTEQHNVVAMTAGHYHTCALLDTGRIKCWGYNGQGQLGLGDAVDRGTSPAQMGNALPAVDL